jgi:hypothetical protein
MAAPATNITYSQNESDLLMLKVGRCVSDNFDEQQLLNIITSREYDICRLSVPAGDEHAVSKLERMGLPYYYSGTITRYKTLIAELAEGKFIHDDLEYEEYDGTQNELLLKLLKGTWGEYPIGYYRTPYLKNLINKEQEILCVFEFYRKHNLKKNYPDNTIMFIRHRENYVGFFALNIIGNRLESHIGGIVDPYREGGYFYDMQEYIRRFCIGRQLKYFCFGARNENRRVNAIFQKFGYRAVDADNVFHIAPLLSYTAKEPLHTELVVTGKDIANVHDQLLKEAHRRLQRFDSSAFTFKINNMHSLIPGRYNIITTCPVCTNEQMAVLKIYNTEKSLVCCAYLCTV